MFDQKTKEKLRYYVYLLIDPETEEPFYVGKGKDDRVFAHVDCALEIETENDKYDKIREIFSRGNKVNHIIVRHGLSESEAFSIESSLIDTFKYIPKFQHFILGNIQGGINSIEKGLMTSDEIIRLYNAEPLTSIGGDCVIININSTYNRGSFEDAIFKATKETWDIKKTRTEMINYVLSEFRGLIVEVFKVNKWYAKERGYGKNAKKFGQTKTGYGFEGDVASQSIRELYVNKSISGIKPRGFAGVIIYPETLSKWKMV